MRGWLGRWLQQEMGVETVVLDPASLLVNRKAKQRKTDLIDARKMVRALLAYDRGDAAVLSRVRVPSVEEEDRKRLLRERQRLVKERTALTNAIKGLLQVTARPSTRSWFDRRPQVSVRYHTWRCPTRLNTDVVPMARPACMPATVKARICAIALPSPTRGSSR